MTNVAVYTHFTPTEDGTVTYCHVTTDFAGWDNGNIGIWSATGTLLVDSSETNLGNSAENQVNFLLDSAYCLVSGTTYKVGLVKSGADTAWNVNSNTDTTDGVDYDNTSITTGDTLGNISETPDGELESDQMHIWCDNSAT